MLNTEIKENSMKRLAVYREGLKAMPQLKNLFLELTLRCNERCLHCGSSCGDVPSEELSVEQYRTFLTKLKEDMGTEDYMLCITGGEPLLRKEFFEIMGIAHELGFKWGMTSNGTLITEEVARKLKEVGMGTISISLDGLPETHDAFRRTPNGWKRAMDGIMNLLKVGGFQAVQVTTVCSHKSIQELDALYEILKQVDIDSWRVVNMDPIGRAKEHPELLLTKEDYKTLFEFIRNKRIAGEPVCYGCSHYLGMEYEREVRDWYFLCTAGLYTASIMVNGDITACLDIERRPEFIQGNILKDNFKDVWENKFEIFRRDLSEDCEKCRNCKEQKYCHGDAYHTWDFDNNCPQVCFKDILFD
ncbi:MAG: radical SAM protein [Oscillospiraceae bacterium]|nr:radical SAM protein [Oscillospiraceae bacterium]MCR4759452.1 radical SAM protein [Oscillospiraceae bacterium]